MQLGSVSRDWRIASLVVAFVGAVVFDQVHRRTAYGDRARTTVAPADSLKQPDLAGIQAASDRQANKLVRPFSEQRHAEAMDAFSELHQLTEPDGRALRTADWHLGEIFERWSTSILTGVSEVENESEMPSRLQLVMVCECLAAANPYRFS